jgi:pantetheine-phosphate adenylyltransferase
VLPASFGDRSTRPLRAVYPGTFDPFTPGHADIVARARHVFDRVTILVAINSTKVATATLIEKAERVRAALPSDWATVDVDICAALTATYCREHDVAVIIRGIRNTTDAMQEYRLAAMNESQGVQTLLLPARPELSGVSSTMLRYRTDPPP